MSRRRLGFRSVRCPEQLETRAMLAGNGFPPFAMGMQAMAGPPAQQAMTQFVSSETAGRPMGRGGMHGPADFHSRGDEASFTATLTDSEGTATGTATYSTHTNRDGETETTFSVSVTGATASTTYDVAVAGTVVGQLTTDDAGDGELVLSSEPTDGEQELPADFPTEIAADTAITIGTLSGALVADADDGDGGGSGCHRGSVDTSLDTSLTDSDTTSTATGTASYTVSSESGVTKFSVSVTGAAASTTLDVSIDDTLVGQLTTDETGAGSLVLSSDPTDTEQALPADFPTKVSAGSTVTVGTLSGTLASSSSTTTSETNFGFSFVRFGGRRR